MKLSENWTKSVFGTMQAPSKNREVSTTLKTNDMRPFALVMRLRFAAWGVIENDSFSG
jgi:hypothetical protein